MLRKRRRRRRRSGWRWFVIEELFEVATRVSGRLPFHVGLVLVEQAPS